MQWSEVINNPYLQDLPFKIELNRYGKIEMSPASNKHGYLQSLISALFINKLEEGKTFTECSIQTAEGVKVADVAWCSKEFFTQYGFETPYAHAPEICVEIVSPSNSKIEISNKIRLYLQAGAAEIWVVWENEIVDYYDKTGKLEQSGYDINVKL